MLSLPAPFPLPKYAKMTVLVFSLVPALAGILYTALLFITWRHDLQSKVNRRFAWYLTSMIIWSAGALMMYLDRGHALAWNRLMLSGVTLMPLAFWGFVQAFLGLRRFDGWLPIGVALYLGFLILNFRGLLATGIAVTEDGIIKYTLGPAIPIFGIYFAVFIGASAWNLMSTLRAKKDFIVVNRTRYILIGMIFVLIGGTTNVVDYLGSYPIDIAGNAINAIIIAYVIFRYSLLDFDIVIRKGLAYSIPTIIIGISYFLIISLVVNLLHLVAGYQVLIASLLVAGVAAVFMQPLRDASQAWVDKYFFREKYDVAQMLQRLSQTTVSVLDPGRLGNMILDELTQTMHVDTAMVVLLDKESHTYELKAQRGLPPTHTLTMRSDNPIVKWLADHDGILTIDEINVIPRFRGLWRREREELSIAKAELFLPLKVHTNLAGLIVLGPKLSEAPYSPDEHLTLMTLANQTAIAVENARLYQTVVDEKERAEIILQQAFAGIIVLDQDLRVVAMNPSAEGVTGYAATEIMGKRFIELFGPEMWEKGSPLYTTLETGQSIAPVETVLASASGRRDVLLGVTPVSDGFLLNFTDITRLKEIDRLKSNIVASVSHELRTPLTSIKGYTDLMLEGFGSQDEKLRHQFLTIINNEADRLTAFINDLLDLARLESGRTEPVTDELYLDSIIAESVRVLQVQAQQARVTIHVDIPKDLPVLRGSRQLMISVVKNLIGNAIKFSLEGGDVDVSAWNTEDAVMFDVVDHGMGIPPEDLPHLFSKFYRSQTAWKSGIKGTGLGLALAKEAVEVHHGMITVESQVGYGSRFTVALPLANDNGQVH